MTTLEFLDVLNNWGEDLVSFRDEDAPPLTKLSRWARSFGSLRHGTKDNLPLHEH